MMKIRPRNLVLVTLLLFLASAAGAGDAPESGEVPVIDALRAGGAEVTPLGSGGSLSGYLVIPSRGAAYSLYIAEDGHAVAGLLYDPEGRLLTGRQIAETSAGFAIPPRGAKEPATGSQAGALRTESHASRFGAARAAFGFTLGSQGPLVLLFADPSCPWSRSAVARLGQLALSGGVRLRVVPVGVLGARAAERAAAIASAPRPELAWFNPEGLSIRPEGARRIAANNALYEDWEQNSVPLVLWRTADGGVRNHVGDIQDIDSWRRQLGHE